MIEDELEEDFLSDNEGCTCGEYNNRIYGFDCLWDPWE